MLKIKNAKQLASAQKEINMHELGMTIAKATVATAIEMTLAILAYIHGDKKSFDADIESTIRKYADKEYLLILTIKLTKKYTWQAVLAVQVIKKA